MHASLQPPSNRPARQHPPTLVLLIKGLPLHQLWQTLPQRRLRRAAAQALGAGGLRCAPPRLCCLSFGSRLTLVQQAGGGAPGAAQLAGGWVPVPGLRDLLGIQEAVVLHLWVGAAGPASSGRTDSAGRQRQPAVVGGISVSTAVHKLPLGMAP